MKTILLLVGGVIGLVLLIFAFDKFISTGSQVASYNMDDPEAPKIEMQEETYDFGDIDLDYVASHEFKITNIGKNPLVITGIITSCHCTSAVLKISGLSDSPEFGMHALSGWKGEIAPGVEANLEVIYKPAEMPVKGQVSRVITFSSNDPTSKEVQLEVTAKVL